MADSHTPTQPDKLSLIILIATLGIGLILVGLLLIPNIIEGGRFIYMAVVSSLSVLLIVALAAQLFLLVRKNRHQHEAMEHAISHLERLETLQEHQNNQLDHLEQLASLSDQAKSLIYHEQELEALRETLNAMVLKQDYHSAETVLKRMDERLGLGEEAATLRSEIENARKATKDEKINTAADRVQSLLDRQDWAQARREANRLKQLFPDHPRITALPKTIKTAWNRYKAHLLKSYGEAVRVNDVEKSIELLKELDKYLTPQEGSALAESARDVFKKKLHNLGVQFAIAATDQQWQRAVETGEEIIAEFPNTRMAREVREKLPMLRSFASGAAQPPADMTGQQSS
jgi:negative regulator of replication initiation